MRFIKKKEFVNLISLPNTQLKNEINVLEDGRDYYLLQDGRILAYSQSTPNRIQLFESIDELNNIIKIATSNVEEVNILEKYQGLIADIPNSLETSKTTLSNELGIDRELLDFSLNSIKLIDKQIKVQLTLQVYLNKIYGFLLLYFGEVVRREVMGEWGKENKGGLIEPYILDQNRNKIYYSKELHEQASEDFKKFSVLQELKVVINI